MGTVHAGEAPGVSVGVGEAVEVSTGAVLPPGADAVVIVEETEPSSGGRVTVGSAVAPGENVMVAGSDVPAGARALGPGTVLSPREIGLLAALGVDAVPVVGRPRVGIVSTGDELVRPGEPIDHAAGQIHDVNTAAVAAAVEDAGGEAVVYPHVGDDLDAMEDALNRGADECDLVVTSGSTSASAVDVVYRVIETRGELLLHGVAVKPGKPMVVGRIGGAAYVGLPGYPVSALTIFRVFVAPAIRAAAGLDEPPTATLTGRFAGRLRYPEGRLRYVPVGLVGTGGELPVVYPVDKGSGATTSLADADGVVAMDPDRSTIEAGETVEVELFTPGSRPPSVLVVGEEDPALSAVLDRLDRPRFLRLGPTEAGERLGDGAADVVSRVVDGAAPVEAGVVLGGWTREWGLVVPAGAAGGVGGAGALLEADIGFVNRPKSSGLRASFDAALEALAEARGTDPSDLTAAIDGYDRIGPGLESPVLAVEAGEADAGLGLRASAEARGLGFVGLGRQHVELVAAGGRRDKPGVRALRGVLDAELDAVCSGLAGFSP